MDFSKGVLRRSLEGVLAEEGTHEAAMKGAKDAARLASAACEVAHQAASSLRSLREGAKDTVAKTTLAVLSVSSSSGAAGLRRCLDDFVAGDMAACEGNLQAAEDASRGAEEGRDAARAAEEAAHAALDGVRNKKGDLMAALAVLENAAVPAPAAPAPAPPPLAFAEGGAALAFAEGGAPAAHRTTKDWKAKLAHAKEKYISRTVKKVFDGVPFQGEIVDVYVEKWYGPTELFYRVHFEDGDKEDMTRHEMLSCLVPFGGRGGGGGGGGGGHVVAANPRIFPPSVCVRPSNLVAFEPVEQKTMGGTKIRCDVFRSTRGDLSLTKPVFNFLTRDLAEKLKMKEQLLVTLIHKRQAIPTHIVPRAKLSGCNYDMFFDPQGLRLLRESAEGQQVTADTQYVFSRTREPLHFVLEFV